MPAKKGTSILLSKWCKDNDSNLVNEWVESVNGKISLETATTGMHCQVIWQGKCGHKWTAPVYSRVAGNGCPYCHGKKVLRGYNDLESQYPDIAGEYDRLKNEKDSSEVYCHTNSYAYWKCNNGHEWRAQVKSRTIDGRGCRICAGQAPIIGVNDFQTTCPELSKQWNFEKNGSLKPSDVMKGSNKPVWWICDKKHEWKAMIYSRAIAGNGCPECVHEQKISFNEKTVAYYLSKHFEIEESKKMKCLGKMELDIYISKFKIGVEYDGQAFHHDVERDQRKNTICSQNGITLIRLREPGCPEINACKIVKLSGVHLKDIENGIVELLQIIKNITGCQFDFDINIKRDRLEIMNLLKMSVKDGSLSENYPNVAKEWLESKNGAIKPNVISYASNKTFWWKCKKGHEWESAVYSRTLDGHGCPYCSGKRLTIGENDFATICPSLLKEWDYSKNDGGPEQYHAKSHKDVWWIDSFGHSYKMEIYRRTDGRGCPYCANRKILRGFNDFETLLPNIAAEWDYEKNDRFPYEFSKSSHFRPWWICKNGHSWATEIRKRTEGSGCPKCARMKTGT